MKMKDQSRNFNPHRPARCAMWLYGKRYSEQGGGSMDFWDRLTPSEQNTCRRMASEIAATRPEYNVTTSNIRIKAIYVRNLNMPEAKIASQVSHAVKNLGVTPIDCTVVVLKVSQKKFNELVKEHPKCYVQIDRGLTVVKEGTKTAAAWIEE